MADPFDVVFGSHLTISEFRKWRCIILCGKKPARNIQNSNAMSPRATIYKKNKRGKEALIYSHYIILFLANKQL